MERRVYMFVCEWMFVNFVRVRAGGGEGLCVRAEGGEGLSCTTCISTNTNLWSHRVCGRETDWFCTCESVGVSLLGPIQTHTLWLREIEFFESEQLLTFHVLINTLTLTFVYNVLLYCIILFSSVYYLEIKFALILH